MNVFMKSWRLWVGVISLSGLMLSTSLLADVDESKESASLTY